MARSYCNLLYHLVFSTQGREPWFDAEMLPRVHRYLGGAIRDENGVALAVGGTADHVHLLAKLRQDKALSDVLRGIKANSSGWVRRTFPNPLRFRWQAGYGAFTVSQSMAETVRAYVEGQEEHHRKVSFKTEFVTLLERHGVEYDERYLWRDDFVAGG